jgi:cytidylate kinase
MDMVITVSRQLGSGGSYIATAAAEALGYRYLDREILQRAANAAGYPDEEMVQALARHERIPGILERMLDALGRMSAVPIVPSATLREGQAYVELMDSLLTAEVMASRKRQQAAEGYLELVCDTILSLAETGNVVIVGRGGQVILRERRNVLHVRVVASYPTRVRNLMAHLDISREEAQSQIEESDRDRARYLKRYHDVDWADPLLYHLVINTDRVPVPLGEHLIVETARWLASAMA